MPGYPTDVRLAAVGQQRAQREQPGRDDERLGDLGVTNRVGIARRSVLQQVDACCVGDGGEVLSKLRFGDPGAEKPGGLRALAGADDHDHLFSLSRVEKNAVWFSDEGSALLLYVSHR